MGSLSPFNSSKTAALYIRVSTHEQEELSPDSQRRLLLDYAAAHSMAVKEDYIYQENGVSGRKAQKRPQFLNMIADAKSEAHPFDVILVWKFSRFARNQEESIVYKSMLKNKCGVEVISISEPIMDGPFGSLIERIIEWMDEFYSIRLSGDVTRGMTEKALRGGCQCRPPLGYCVPSPGSPLEPVPEEAAIVRQIFEWYALEGRSLLSIVQDLNAAGARTALGNPFEKRALAYILQNPIYAGQVRWNRVDSKTGAVRNEEQWIVVQGSHPAIVPKEWSDRAIKRMREEQSRPRARPQESARHWLSGVLKCPECGRSLVSCVRRKKRGPDAFSFQCGGYRKGLCPNNCYVTEEAVAPAILRAFEEVLALDPQSSGLSTAALLSDSSLSVAERNAAVKHIVQKIVVHRPEGRIDLYYQPYLLFPKG